MKGKKIQKNSSEKLFAFVVFTIASILGLIYAMNPNVFSSLVVNKDLKAAGTVPDHTKGLIANGDGTYKLSLDVKGEAEKKAPKVNVIVIVDRSGSMGDKVVTYRYNATNSTDDGLYGLVDGEYVPLTRQWSYSGREWRFYYNGNRYTGQRYRREEVTSNDTRMDSTKTAVNSLASTLLAYNGKDGNPSDTVEMALVTFATTAQTTLEETTSSTTFTNAVNNISVATGNAAGTNWEAALKQANTISFGSNDNDPTFVIFFSDGAPTFYDRNNGGTNGTGHEEEPNMANSYNAATDDANTLATKVGTNNFYTIFAFGKDYGATYMTNLTTAAGAPSGNNYSASDTTALQKAFNDILTKIEMAGIANATINDGTTHNVKTTSGQIANLLEVDEDSFKYYKDDVEWITAPKATFNKTTGEVEWDLSSLGVLENGVTYKVTFDVYPSQYTYDIVSEMKNGDLTWLSLDENVRKYIDANGNLKTNTSATLHYKDTRVGDQPKTADYTNPDPVETEFFKIGAKKNWVNLLDDKVQNDKDLILTVTRDGEEFHEVTLNKNNNYTIDATSASAIHIAPGLMKTVLDEDTNNKSIRILDAGHDYTFKELDGDYYNWDIKTETVHPMIIDGQLKDLVLVDENLLNEHPEYAIPSAMGNSTYYQADENSLEYVKINGKTYIIRSNKAITLDATNNRRSNLNIVKKVDGASAPADAEFDFNITVTDNGIEKTDKIYLTVFDTNDCDATTKMCKVIDLGNVTGWEKEPGTAWSGYYMAPSGTSFSAKLKDGYNVLVTNLTDKASYVITESNLPTHFSFDASQTTVSAENNTGDITLPKSAYTVGNQQVTGSIDRDNASYTVQVTNVYDLVDVSVKKVWDDNRNQDGKRGNGAVFNLYANGKKVNGKTQTIAEDGTVTFADLDRFDENGEIVYTVVEDAISGYTTTPADATDATKGVSDGTTVTNKHVPEVIDVSVTKEWDDNNNQDGKRGKVTFKLNGESPIELDGTADDLKEGESGETAAWVATWKNLPKYRNGQAIDYHVTEDSEPTDYTVSYGEDGKTFAENGGTIKNIHTPETTEVSVTKIWDDGDNRDNKRPDKITFKLSNNDTIELDGTVDNLKDGESGETAPWVATFRNLPKYENGNVISYTVVEASVPTGYTVSYGENGETSAVNGGTIKNTYEPEVTSAMVKKVWDDNDNQDGKRPTSIKVTLSDGKKYSKEVVLNAGNQWTAGVTGLPKNDKGQAITYTWTEDENDLNGYELTNTVPSDIKDDEGVVIGKLTTFTNSYTPETTEVSVTKSWDDNNNQDGKRDKVVFKLSNNTTIELDGIADNLKEGESGETAPWVATWKNLPKYENPTQETGKQSPINYTVIETSTPAGYTVSYGENGETFAVNGGTIKNTHEIEKIDIEITKVWDDNSNQDGIRPVDDKVFHLYANGIDISTQVERGYSESEDGNTWYVGFTNLEKYKGGKEIEYIVKEDSITGYTTTPESREVKDGGTITNTHVPETVEVSVTKEWKDEDNRDGVRPSSVTFRLSNGETITLDGEVDNNGEDKAWVATFKNLPKYENDSQESGKQKEIEYTVTESSTDRNYIVSYGEGKTSAVDGGTITNTHEIIKTTVSVTKSWDDSDNQDGLRPDSVTFKLSNGQTITLDGEVDENGEDAAWVATFKDLPKYENDSQESGKQKEIEYTVTESSVPSGYTVSYGDDGAKSVKDGGTITNIYTPETTEVSVTKVWKDDNNRDGLRPASVTFKLSNGDTITLDGEVDENGEDAAWVATFKNLPKYENTSGVSGEAKEIDYTVVESSVPQGYTVSYGEGKTSAVNGGTITNTHKTETVEVSATKEWDDNNNQDGIRPDSVTFKLSDGKTITLDGTVDEKGEDTAWVATFKNLPKYENTSGVTGEQKEIDYTVTEVETSVINGKDAVGTYRFEVSGNQNSGYTITNIHTPETITIKGEKIWVDEEDVEGLRPTTIQVNLYGTDKNTPLNTVIVSANDKGDWFYTFEDDASGQPLPKYENPNQTTGSQKEINYTVKEIVDRTTANYYTSSIDPNNKFNIINTHVVRNIQLTIVKEWDDKNNRYGHADSIDVVLSCKVEDKDYCGGSDYTYTLSKDNNWTKVVEDLPKTDGEGHLLNYTVKETDDIEDYSVSYDYENVIALQKDATEIETTITNTYTPQTKDIEGEKIWDDDDNNDVIRPESITIDLFDGISEEPIDTITVEPDEEGNWYYSFTGLPVKANGQEITYELKEHTVEGYTTIQDGYNFTNYHNPETVTFSVSKVWDDNDNNDGKRTKEVTVRLFGDGVEKEVAVLSESNNWTHTFKPYKKYKNVDNERVTINYEIIEDEVTDYEATLSEKESVTTTTTPKENGTKADQTNTNTIYDLTNKHKNEKTSIIINKSWEDDENHAGKRPNSITVYVYADDVLFKTIVLTKDGGWTYTLNDLAVYKDGKKIKYTIKEAEIEDYEGIVNGYNITNVFTGGTGEVVPPNTGIEEKTSNKVVEQTIYYFYLFLATMVLGYKRIILNN